MADESGAANGKPGGSGGKAVRPERSEGGVQAGGAQAGGPQVGSGAAQPGTGGVPSAGFGAGAIPGAAEFARMFSEFKIPGMGGFPDMQALMEAHRRNMETLTAANRVALEGAQTVARRNMEIMQQMMGEFTETMQAMATPDAPQARAAKQAELVKRAYEHAVANMRELSDLIQRSNAEALQLLNQRFSEAMDEMRALMQKAGQAGG